MYTRYLNSYTHSAYNAPKVYPQDIQCIVEPLENKGGVYISNVEAAQNLNTLKRHNIKAILTAAKGVTLTHPKADIHSIKYVPADDHETFDLSVYFDEAGEWILENLKIGNILVHCMAGVSRSVSLFLAYLIKHKNMKYNDAYDLVKAKRRIIQPNSGFVRQLRMYEQKHRANSIQKHRTPSPAQKRRLTPETEPKTATTPNLLRYTDYRPYSNYKTSSPYIQKMKASLYEKPTYSPEKRTESDLDQKIEQIRKKYSNKSEYLPSTASKYQRQHSSYKLAKPNGSLFERDPYFSKYYSDEYRIGGKISDRLERMRNPEMYSGRSKLYNNFLLGGGY